MDSRLPVCGTHCHQVAGQMICEESSPCAFLFEPFAIPPRRGTVVGVLHLPLGKLIACMMGITYKLSSSKVQLWGTLLFSVFPPPS